MDSGHSVDRRVKSGSRPVSIVVPTYRRDSVLIATIGHLLELDPAPAEILVVDQTERHQETVECTLRNWEAAGRHQIGALGRAIDNAGNELRTMRSRAKFRPIC